MAVPFTRELWSTLATMLTLPLFGSTAAAQGKPDIILVVVDDEAWHEQAYMPRTNELIGERGVRFTRAFASTPLCCPSRATLLTGLYSHHHGVLSNAPPLGGATRFEDASTLATWLRAAGYRTGLFGKYLNDYDGLTPWPYVPPGWARWVAHVGDGIYYDYDLVEDGRIVHYRKRARDYSVTVLKSKALEFIESTPQSKPLFLYFAPIAPHATCTDPLGNCDPILPRAAPGDEGTFGSLAPWRPFSYNETDVSDKPVWVRRLPALTKTARDSTDLFRQRQVEALQSVDRSVEALVQALDAAGRLDNAVIIYMSDNGLALGEHRYAKGKGCAYEPCIQVPFMIRAPGVAPRVDDHLISNVDLAPTIAALAGVTPLPPVDGMDLGPLLSNPAAPWRDAVFIEYLGKSRLVNFQGVRTATHVYVEYENGDQELYDLPADPDQLTNVVDDPEYASTVAELRDKLNDLRTAEPSAPIEGRAPAR